MSQDAAAAPRVAASPAPAGRARTPLQLAWRRLRRYRLAVVGGVTLVCLYAAMALAPFLAPYALDYSDRSLFYAPPVGVHWVDARGRLHLRPFVYAYRVVDASLPAYAPDTSRTYDIHFFVRGAPYRLLWIARAAGTLLAGALPRRRFCSVPVRFAAD